MLLGIKKMYNVNNNKIMINFNRGVLEEPMEEYSRSVHKGEKEVCNKKWASSSYVFSVATYGEFKLFIGHSRTSPVSFTFF